MDDVRERNLRYNTEKLCSACFFGNIEEVEDVLSNEEVDINGGDNCTPLVSAVLGGHLNIVRRLLEHPDLQLGKKDDIYGDNALHVACENNRLSILNLLCQDRRCTPNVVNKKDIFGCTPLMGAVIFGHLDIVKELDKEGTDFFTKTSGDGLTLIQMAKMMSENVLQYMVERNRVDSLELIAAHNVARYVRNKADVETLEIPETVQQLLVKFVDNADSQVTRVDEVKRLVRNQSGEDDAKEEKENVGQSRIKLHENIIFQPQAIQM